jgi:PiT family inorganic phosphate transporter
VSFAHGSNDGQKGMGLIMLILIGIVPAGFALNLNSDAAAMSKLVNDSHASVAILDRINNNQSTPSDRKHMQEVLSAYLRSGQTTPETMPSLSGEAHSIDATITNAPTLKDVPAADRANLRSDIYLVSESLNKMLKGQTFSGDDKKTLGAFKDEMKSATMFIPIWVKAAVAIALGLGTMIGWKRIVITVGEKIGKAHLTYAQGASAELVTMATISGADAIGLPVSTTHILSSGIAGTMAANKSGLQKDTVRNILLAWVLTLPVCVFLGATLFAAGLFVVFRLFGGH